MYNIQMKPDAPLRYGFHALPVPAGHVNAHPVAIPAPGIVVGSVSKPMHHCLYQDGLVIWRNYKPQLAEWPEVAPSRQVAGFCPPSLLANGSAARSDAGGIVTGFIAGRITLSLRSEIEDGFNSFGVLWDLNGSVVRTVNLPKSTLKDVNESGDAVGNSIDWVGRRHGIFVSPKNSPAYLEDLLQVRNSWVITDALSINSAGEILAFGFPRSRISDPYWIVLIPASGGYMPIAASEWLSRTYGSNTEHRLEGADIIDTIPRGGKFVLFLAGAEQMTVAVREMRPVRLSFRAKPAPRRGTKYSKWPRFAIKAEPLPSQTPLRTFFPIICGASDDDVFLGSYVYPGGVGINSVLLHSGKHREVFRPRGLCSDIPPEIQAFDPLVIGAGGELGGQCRIEGVLNGYVMERLD